MRYSKISPTLNTSINILVIHSLKWLVIKHKKLKQADSQLSFNVQ